MATTNDLLQKIIDQLRGDSSANEQSISNIRGQTEIASKLGGGGGGESPILNALNNINEATRSTSNIVREQLSLNGMQSQMNFLAFNSVKEQSTRIQGENARFTRGVENVKIDPSTGAGIAAALAFSTFPRLADFYVQGVDALATAFSKVDTDTLKKIEEGSGGFTVLTQVLQTLGTVRFGGLIKSAIGLKLIGKTLGKHLGATIININDGISEAFSGAGLKPQTFRVEYTRDADGKVTTKRKGGKSPFGDLVDGISSLVNSIVTLTSGSATSMLGSALMFRFLAGFVGRSFAAGFKKLQATLPDGSFISGMVQQIKDLDDINDAFGDIHIIDKDSAEKMLQIGQRIFKINKGLNKVVWDELLEGITKLKYAQDAIMSIPDASFAAWNKLFQGLAPLGETILVTNFRNLEKIAAITRKIGWLRFMIGMRLFKGISHSISIAIKTLGSIKKTSWTAAKDGMKSFHEIMKQFGQTAKLKGVVGGIMKIAGSIAAIGISLGIAIAAIAGAFYLMPPIKQVVSGIATLAAAVGAGKIISTLNPAHVAKGALALSLLAAPVALLGLSMRLFSGTTLKDIGILAAAFTVVGGAAALMGLGGPLVYIGAGAAAALGLALYPFAKGIKEFASAGLTLKDVGILAAAIATVGGAAALMGLGGPLVYIGAGALGALGLAMYPFAKAMAVFGNIDFSSFSGADFLDFASSLGFGSIGLGLAAPGMLAAALGIYALGKAFKVLTSTVKPKELKQLGPAIKGILESMSGFGFKAIGMWFVSRSVKAIAGAFKGFSRDIDSSTIYSVQGLFDQILELMRTSDDVDEDSLDSMTDNIETIIESILELGKRKWIGDKAKLNAEVFEPVINFLDAVNRIKRGDQSQTETAIPETAIPEFPASVTETLDGGRNINFDSMTIRELKIGTLLIDSGMMFAGAAAAQPLIVNNIDNSVRSNSSSSTSSSQSINTPDSPQIISPSAAGVGMVVG